MLFLQVIAAGGQGGTAGLIPVGSVQPLSPGQIPSVPQMPGTPQTVTITPQGQILGKSLFSFLLLLFCLIHL